jgi:hypothetical protein
MIMLINHGWYFSLEEIKYKTLQVFYKVKTLLVVLVLIDLGQMYQNYKNQGYLMVTNELSGENLVA